MATRSTTTRRKTTGGRQQSTGRRKSTGRKKTTGRKKGPRKKGGSRKYSPSASENVREEMHEYKRGKLKSGPGGKGGKVKSRKQAIAIGLSEARAEGKKVPSQPKGRGRKKA